MHWDEVGSQVCSVARAMGVLGDRWTMLIVREALLGTATFDEFVGYTGATPQVVSARLKRLVQEKILKKKPLPDSKGRFAYVLTEKGQDLNSVICSIMGWGDKWLADGQGRPHVLRHVACGCETSPKLACDVCGDFISYKTLRSEPGPAMKRTRMRMLAQAS